MQIQINSDHNIDATEALAAHVEDVITRALHRFAGRISRIEVHLGDENAGKHGADDKRCMLEARVEGLQPIAVTHDAETVHDAVHGAAEKMKHALEHSLGRLRDEHR
ncbi:MAG: HPF/RaiA family ribosome-associated protein [Kofleriaceae bacterium]|nr:HPF/RaiA family ribosome-associated protein [Kofleriaceae bacterium]MCB9573163.1 HPF/RaiA family ribosome-associated protein [Kofleriaceae bacterium]